MKTARLLTAFFFTASIASAENKSKDPTAVGWDDDIHVEASLISDAIAPGATIGVRYEIHNLSPAPIAIADKVCSATYDPDSHQVVVSIGSEIPDAASLRRLTVIPPGVSKVFTGGAALMVARGPNASRGPRYVQIKVNVLRRWTADATTVADTLFDRWLESNATILLNPLPVYFGVNDLSRQGPSAEMQ